MADSGQVDTALIAALKNDATLTGQMPDGVYVDVAPSGKTRFVIISLVTETDTETFNNRAFEDAMYLVKAVDQSTSGAGAKAAAARIDELLHGATIPVTGYNSVTVTRDERVRYVEVDETNPDTRWQHSGARYSVFVST